MMHTTQFTEPGCRFLNNEATTTNGWLDPTNASTLVVFDCETWIVIVVETSGLNQSLSDVTLQLSRLPQRLTVPAASGFDLWRTCEGQMFQKIGEIPMDASGNFIKITFLPRCIHTLVSTSAKRGSAIPPKTIPGSASFPDHYSDTFDSYSDQGTVKYFTDESGSFNAAKPPPLEADAGLATSSGMVLQQAVTQRPIQGAWWGACSYRGGGGD